jgi:hypothetical protein
VCSAVTGTGTGGGIVDVNCGVALRWSISIQECKPSYCCVLSSGFDRGKRGGDALVVSISSEIPLSAVVVLVDTHECRAREIGHVTGNTAIGPALIYAFKQLDPLNDGDTHQDERDLEALLDEAQPGWRSVVVKRQFLPRIQATGMLPTAETGGYSGRPRPDVTGVSGLYVAGDWVGPGFLAEASFGSGREAARRILNSPARGGDPRDSMSRPHAAANPSD